MVGIAQTMKTIPKMNSANGLLLFLPLELEENMPLLFDSICSKVFSYWAFNLDWIPPGPTSFLTFE